MSESIYDLAVIGGGVNGVGIARDAVGRGASVILFEQGDLAEGTSSRSSKLIHGGLRYLEHYAFRLVRESLEEREVLWRMAPHIVWPLRFVLPHHEGLRPRWMLRTGLFLYDHLGGRKMLPPTRTLDLRRDGAGEPLKAAYKHGFEYSDCWVDDARLVVLNAKDAASRGAEIYTRERVVAARRADDVWLVESEGRTVKARALVNAAGPWVEHVLKGMLRLKSPAPIRLVRGSHIIVPRLHTHDRAYILQNADGRVVFVLPYETDFTLIGTTDHDFDGDPAAVRITDDEIAYLCAAVSEYFRAAVSPRDVVASYSGVRPLYDDGASAAKDATRDYVLSLDHEPGAPLLSVFGGKITTYRRLAEHALEKLEAFLPALRGRAWTKGSSLPGGEFAVEEIANRLSLLKARYAFLNERTLLRLHHAYGRDAASVLGEAAQVGDLGAHFGAGLYQREVEYLVANEWARTPDDILWRRTKLGLHFTAAQSEALGAHLAALSAVDALRFPNAPGTAKQV